MLLRALGLRYPRPQRWFKISSVSDLWKFTKGRLSWQVMVEQGGREVLCRIGSDRVPNPNRNLFFYCTACKIEEGGRNVRPPGEGAQR